MGQIFKATDDASEYFHIKNKMIEIKKKKQIMKDMEPCSLKVRMAIEIEMKEKTLQKRIIRKFSKIKGHNREEI